MTPDGTESVLYSFGAYRGDSSYAVSGLFQARDGNFYGTTDGGGTNNKGSVFKVSPSGVETVLYSFGSVANDPAAGFSSLVEGDDGNFYGTSANGGASKDGAVFQITPQGTLTLVHSFPGGSGDGSFPSSGLLKGSDGNFYGVTLYGGSNDAGIVYKLTPAGIETIVYAFDYSDAGLGSRPAGTLDEDSDGNLYGSASAGGSPRTVCTDTGCTLTDGESGTIFEISAAGNGVLLSNFGPTDADGTGPSGPPIQGQDGNLYGVTGNGGATGNGEFYRITR